MRYTDEQLLEIQAKTTAAPEDNAAVVLPLALDLQDARQQLVAAQAALATERAARERAERAAQSYFEATERIASQRISVECRLEYSRRIQFHYMDRATSAEDLLATERAESTKLRAALQIARENCPCSPRERDSGHRIDCFVLEIDAALAEARK